MQSPRSRSTDAPKRLIGKNRLLGASVPRCGLPLTPMAIALLLAAFSSGILSGQQPAQKTAQTPQATFRTGTRLVVHTVTVKDKDGNPVEGLTAKDFVVTENNEPQDVAFAVFQRLQGEPDPTTPALAEPAAPAPPLSPACHAIRTAGRPSADFDAATGRHQVSEPAPARPVFRHVLDGARRTGSGVHQRAEVHGHTDDAIRPRWH